MAVWRSGAQLPEWFDLEVAIMHQSDHALVWQLGASPVAQEDQPVIENQVHSRPAQSTGHPERLLPP